MSLRIHQPDFCPGIIHYISQPARLKLAGLFREKKPARQVNQPVFNQSHIIEIIVGQTSIIAELYLKIDFPLNEPVSSQPVSYNNQVLRFGLEKIFSSRLKRQGATHMDAVIALAVQVKFRFIGYTFFINN